ncbi:MAG TPA: tetratricopeptide repeat protein [bacterium]|nr:tetratricopeptide repeat protein [bacterium]
MALKKKTPEPKTPPPSQATKAVKVDAAPEEGVPKMIEDVIAAWVPKVEQALKQVPAEHLEKAKKEVDKMLSGDLSWADLSQYTPERLMQIAELGFNQFRVGQYDSAERLFKGLTVIDPDNYYFHQMLGATFQRKEKYAEAIVEYSVAADLNPSDVVSFTNRGEVYFKLGVFELAIADFDKAIALDTKGEDKWANRARMLREQIRLMKQQKKK